MYFYISCFLSAALLLSSCPQEKNSVKENFSVKDSLQHKHTNQLIHESSPYLLQHAHNPVNWFPWGDEALEKAKKENKLMLVSIGYSACHWCHVMEHESFEDDSVAKVMNENFVCIKVDREERPDVDQVYMSAVQLMTGSGGWPLNCFTLPDGRPVWGGTYFRKHDWLNALHQLSYLYKNDRQKLQEYARYLIELKLTTLNGNKAKGQYITNLLLRDDFLNTNYLLHDLKYLEKNIKSIAYKYHHINDLIQKEAPLEEAVHFLHLPHREHLQTLLSASRKQKLLAKQLGEHFLSLAKQVRKK